MGNKIQVEQNFTKWYVDYHQDKSKKKLILNEFKSRHLIDSKVKNVQIEITNRCNFACIMCPLDDLTASNKNTDMTFEEFRSIIDQLPSSVEKINMQGLGESYLHKDFLQMLAYAKEKGYYLWNINNGSKFDLKSLEFLDEIWFSLDGVVEEELKEIRKNIKVDSALETVKNTKLYINKNNLPIKTNIYTAVNSKNWENIEYLYEFCDESGIDELHINPTVNNYYYGTEKYQEMEKLISENQIIDWSSFNKKYSKKEYRFDLTIWYPRREMKGLCVWGFDSLYVDKNSNIIGCCRQVTKPLIFGNLKEKSFEEIYNNMLMKSFREAHLEDNPLEMCDNCCMGIPL